VTFVNPTPAKGIFFVMRLFDELAQRRPDVPLRIIEGRGRAEHVAQVAQLCGFDLRFMRSLTISAALPRPRDVFAQTRVLLMPTVRDEAFGRLAAEALLNGVPALVADRGGLPEAVGEGGFVLPIPAGFTFESRKPPLLSEAQPWIDTILRLVDDGVFYEAARGRALSAAGRYAPERLGAAVRAFFASVKRAGAPPLARPGGG
jgi:glycosyltransferase involved in cell wall biosynthesis